MADASGLRTLVTRWGVEVAFGTSRAWEDAVRDAAPKDSGETKQEVRSTFQGIGLGRFRIVVESPTPQTGWTNDGTRPHVIRPKAGKALAFTWPKAGGRVAFAKVNHPGQRGTKWFTRATSAAEARQAVRDGLARAKGGRML